jgi:type I restriction enzyme R subunit
MSTEADICRKYFLPKLLEAGWDNDPHSFTEQRTFTDGRIVVSGDKIRRKKQKRANYLLFSPESCFGVLIALVIVLTCGIMPPYRNITDDSTLNKTEVRYGRKIAERVKNSKNIFFTRC